jgi:hypothetical protein
MSNPYSQPGQMPKRPWYKKKRVLIPGGVVVLAVLGSIAGGGESGSGTREAATPTPSKTASAAPKVSDDPKPKTTAPSRTAESKAPEPVPNVVGMNHADAMTVLHTAGFMVDENSISPGNTFIMLNSNWKVCSQSPAPGATGVLRVTINSVKLDESC